MSEGISLEELQLAARNHGMPLEALRWDLTPLGLHYLLTHYDIPDVDAATWRLGVEGLVGRPLSLSLDDLRSLTMDCLRRTGARILRVEEMAAERGITLGDEPSTPPSP